MATRLKCMVKRELLTARANTNVTGGNKKKQKDDGDIDNTQDTKGHTDTDFVRENTSKNRANDVASVGGKIGNTLNLGVQMPSLKGIVSKGAFNGRPSN